MGTFEVNDEQDWRFPWPVKFLQLKEKSNEELGPESCVTSSVVKNVE